MTRWVRGRGNAREGSIMYTLEFQRNQISRIDKLSEVKENTYCVEAPRVDCSGANHA